MKYYLSVGFDDDSDGDDFLLFSLLSLPVLSFGGRNPSGWLFCLSTRQSQRELIPVAGGTGVLPQEPSSPVLEPHSKMKRSSI